MKVLYDHQTFTLQTYGGISRYFYELYSRFNLSDQEATIPLMFSNNAYLNTQTSRKVKSYFPNNNFPGKFRIQETLNRWSSSREIKGQKFDIFHPTYYDPYFLKSIGNKPFVVTFLDMIHEKFAFQYKELADDKESLENKKLLLKNASKIIAISESTKNDIIEIYGVSGNNIDVIYLGNSILPEKGRQSRLIEGKYLLYVGNRSVYKNFSFYLESIADILISEKLLLVCAGGGMFNSDELEFINKLGLTNLVKFVGVNDHILKNLYSNAEAFVFPSIYEGFGIPVLEAFACQCPCLLSTGGSLSEIGGDSALYFSPDNANEIRSTLMDVLNDQALKTKMINLGTERLKLFSWDKTASQTLNLYKTLI